MVYVRRSLACLLAAATAATLQIALSPVAHAGAVQAKVVSTTAASYTPDINNGVVYSINQVGTRIIVGGDFTTISAHGSTATVNRRSLFAFNATTGAIDTGFAPVLDGVVQGVTPGPTADTVYVTGSFTTVNGVKSKTITLLNTTTGAIVSTFKPPVFNGAGWAVAYANGRLYVAGTFSTVGGVAHNGLASLNPTTGALTSYVTVQLTGHHNYTGSGGANGPVGPRAMSVSPDGKSLIVIGNFKNADGVLHDQIAWLDLSGSAAVVRPDWNTSEYTAACFSGAFDTYMRGVDWAPDGSYFVVAATGGSGTNTDNTRALCDSAARFEVGSAGTDVQATWADFAGQDTILSIAITGTAVYMGGHERWLNNSNGYDYAGPGAVPRPGMGALDPINGLPLAWNPGRNPRGAGAYAMFASPTGLYVGSDTDYFGNFQSKHKKIGFFPLAGGTTPASTAVATLPANVYETGPLPSAANTDVLYRVDTGGGAIAATDNGPDWQADFGSSAYNNGTGSTAGWNSDVKRNDSTLPASAPTALFYSERYGPTNWDFPVASGTSIQVRLYFANRYSGTGAAGQRVFDVDIDGTRVLDDYDIVTDTGDDTGTMQKFDVTSDGDVNIDLSAVTENPLINGIEIVKTGDSAGGTTSATTGDLAYRAYSGSNIGALTTVSGTGIDWSKTRGAFMAGNTIYYGTTDGTFFKAGFNGSSVGTPVAVDPYNDPAWSTVDTGSGQTYRGSANDYYGQLVNVTGAFFNAGRLYYSLLGEDTLHYRYFTPDSGIIGSHQFDAVGGHFSATAGEFVSGSSLYYADRADGTLHKESFADGVVSGTDTVVSGPDVDGNDWRARSLFAYGDPSFPNQLPTASATGTCTELSCAFDGSQSADPDGSIASYAWDFGDGSTGTGATPNHVYATADTFTVKLVVTDNRGGVSPAASTTVTTTAPATKPIGFVAKASSYSTGTTSAKVVTPAAVNPGDTELLFVSTAVGNVVLTPPAGWTRVTAQTSAPLQAIVFRRTAVAGDAGATVPVALSATSAVAVQLLDYRNVDPTGITGTGVSDAATATHTTPAATVAVGGSYVVSFWSDKSSSTTGWTLPASVTARDVTIGTGGGRVTTAVGDGTAAAGNYPGRTATVNAASTKGAMLTVLLRPAG